MLEHTRPAQFENQFLKEITIAHRYYNRDCLAFITTFFLKKFGDYEIITYICSGIKSRSYEEYPFYHWVVEGA